MDTRFNHEESEDKIYSDWKNSGLFSPEKCIESGITNPAAEPFSIVLPPPNVTGTLHMGHAATLVLEDIMVRFNRMRGKKTLWIPGTDDAAIATQSKVEKMIYEKEGKTRHDLDREEFLRRVSQFASESHDTIVTQVKKMGASIDWNREAYTLDEPRGRAVQSAFKEMYNLGLIYRGSRVINWCPHCGSTLADDEVEYKEKKATLYTFKYDKNFPIAISTTRPETKLGDTAVAVHPDDVRYKKYIGQEYEADFCGVSLKIKIVADRSVDPSFGTGALGVTPAHSRVDEEIASKNNLPSIQIIGEDGLMTKKAGLFSGLSIKEARKQIIENLKTRGLLEKEEEVPQNLSVCYRCGTPIEPLPKLQWFIGVNKEFILKNSKISGIPAGSKTTLKKLMRQVVENGQIEIIPDRFKTTYFNWIDNLHDWCISRQIWFGHRIPVWYNKEEIFVGEKPPTPKTGDWQQDSDTLDTWFSSGLWTFSTLGWPENTGDLKTYHPTSILETGYDILFFWVARMILMSICLLGDIPFKKVYLHGLVRDEKGKKMSKSLGNGIDPLDMIKKYGADATRLSLVIGTGPGNDVKLSEDKIRAYRNFTTKIWNVARFILMNKPEDYNTATAEKSLTEEDKNKLADFLSIKEAITAHYEKFEFHLAGEKSYHYLWHSFADKIIEEAKPRLKGADEKDKQAAYFLLEKILFGCLKLLHPFMPFITEEIFQTLKLSSSQSFLMVEKW